MVKRVVAASIGTVAIIAGIFFAFGYALPAFDDLRNPQVSFPFALVGNIIVWVIAAAAIILGVRFVRFASTARHHR